MSIRYRRPQAGRGLEERICRGSSASDCPGVGTYGHAPQPRRGCLHQGHPPSTCAPCPTGKPRSDRKTHECRPDRATTIHTSHASDARSNHDARALAAREAAARRAAARASLEHARALRTVTEQQRRLAAPIYRAAHRDGWWDDPKISATERARAVGLAERFAHVDEDAREVAAEAHRRLEAEARARQAAEARAREGIPQPTIIPRPA